MLWTGDDTVHCDDAYSDKDTVSVLKLSDDNWITVIVIIGSQFAIKVIEIISILSQELNKTGLPVLPVQVGNEIPFKKAWQALTLLYKGQP